MALSNILREPRREITEQAVGAALLGLLFGGDYFIAWYIGARSFNDYGLAMIVLPIVVGVAGFIILAVMFAVHELGEFLCGKLARAGFDPRPRDRR